MTLLRLIGSIALVTASSACGAGERSNSSTPDAAPQAVAPAVEPVESPELRAPEPPSEIEVPAGRLLVGSAPSTPHRFAQHEADMVSVEIPSFTIDRLPYPNDPRRAPTTGVSREEAATLCAEEGKRLCHELEWERACRGDTSGVYPSGPSFDLEDCSINPERCSSPVGVVGLGVIVREWTSSRASAAFSSGDAMARGGHSESPPHEHRCGFRRALPSDTKSEFVGFRCCSGPAPTELEYPTEPERPNLVERDVNTAELRSMLRSVPVLARFAAEFTAFEPQAMNAILNPEEPTGATPPMGAWRTPAQSVLVWSPFRGEELWVFAGHAGDDALIIALHSTPSGGFEHAASFVFDSDPQTVALAHFAGRPDELAWSKCWGCGGEGGVIEYDRQRRRIRIIPR